MKQSKVIQSLMRISRIGSRSLIVSLVGGVLTGLCGFYTAYLIGRTCSIAIQQASSQSFDGQTFIRLGLLFLLVIPFQYLGQMLNITGGMRAENNLMQEAVSHTLSHHEQAIRAGHSGDLMARLTSDASIVGDFYFQGINYRVLNPLVSGFASLIAIFAINPSLGLISLVFGSLTALVSMIFAKRIQTSSQEVREHTSISTQGISEMLANEEYIRLSNNKERMLKRYSKANQALSEATIQTETYTHTSTTINEVIATLTQIVYLIICAYLALNASFNFADIMLLIALQPSVSTAFGNLSASWNFFVEVSVSAKRLLEVLDTIQEDDRTSKPSLTTSLDNPPMISFEDIHFQYNSDTALFNNLNLTIQGNATVAFVGESGSGKTTLFQLLLGLYSPQSGSICINNHDINDYALTSIRDLMIYLQQEAPLFNRSIFENIALGSKKVTVTQEEVEHAAKAANIHDFILTLPNGYDTIVGESANQISGGQRQRIAIARAFMSDAPILIMDEPTSALDSESEQLIQTSLNQLASKKTVLIAAHRLSTIKDADHIVVLNQGEIEEQGNHTELMKQKGTYYRYYQYQSRSEQDDNYS